MLKFIFCSIILLFGPTLWATGNVLNSNPGVGVIAVAGDSLARGRGATNPDNRTPGCFRQNFPGQVESFGVDGRTSYQLLGDLSEVEAVQPKLIFVSSGGNDAIKDFWFGFYPEERTLREMDEIFDRLLATGAVVVYLGLNPPQKAAARLPKISALAASKGVLVVDGMQGLWGTDFMRDQFHPNDQGYQKMCARIVEALQPYYP